MKTALILATAALLTAAARSASITWNNTSGDGLWETPANWSGSNVPNSADRVTISNGNTVARTGDISLNDVIGSTTDGLNLTNGKLTVSGNYTGTTNGGTSSALTNTLGNTSGTTTGILEIGGIFTAGNTNATSASASTFNINPGSSITANSFEGRQGSGTLAATGGWVVNVTGGTFTITTTLDFSPLASPGDQDPTGRITIGRNTSTPLGGIVSIGTISSDWNARPQQYISFLDPLGSLTFGKTNYADLASVEALIASNHLRKDPTVTGSFFITDNGTSWTVTIPEPSALLLGALGLLPFLRRKR